MSTPINEDFIKKLNEYHIKNESIAELKKDLFLNADEDKQQGLLNHDPILDNISIGSHTTCTIEYVGQNWTFRLLETNEFIAANLATNESCKEKETFDKWYRDIILMSKLLAFALSPNPYKLNGEDQWNEHKLLQLNFDILRRLFYKYEVFVDTATKRVDEMSDEELLQLIEAVKKNPELLMEAKNEGNL